MAGEYIFTMQDLVKQYGRNDVLNGINLSFYHGAKIGIVGENGSGKSTVFRIMAGEDQEFQHRGHLSVHRARLRWPAWQTALPATPDFVLPLTSNVRACGHVQG